MSGESVVPIHSAVLVVLLDSDRLDIDCLNKTGQIRMCRIMKKVDNVAESLSESSMIVRIAPP